MAVTGVTGFVGGQVASSLSSLGMPLRLLARRPVAAPVLAGASVERFNYADRALCERALEGVSTLFFVSGAEAEDRVVQHLNVVAAAAAAGVEHVVYTSFVGAAPDSTFTLGRDHFATEEAIRASGMAWTFLRDNLYLDFIPLMVGEDGVIRGPAGDGRAAIVARADVARSAVAVLQEPASHTRRSYDLTGPEALTVGEMASAISSGTGRSVRFEDETLDEAYASRAHYGAPDWQVEAWVSTYTAIAAGDLSQVSGDVQALTGRPPLSLAQFLAAAS